MRSVDMSGDELFTDQNNAEQCQGSNHDQAKEFSACVYIMGSERKHE